MLFIRKIELLEGNYCSAYDTYKYIIYDVYPVCNQYLTRCDQTNLRRKGVILDQSVAKEGGEGGLMSFRAWILKKESRVM